MINDLDCAKLCQSLYNGEEIFDYVGLVENVAFSVKSYPDGIAVIFEGSHNIVDWQNDFDARLICPPALNGAGVHEGFYRGLPSVMVQLAPMLSKTKPIYCIGHSLGAGRAHIFGAMLAVQGYNIVVVAFGSPRPGDHKLAKILYPFPNRSYWNYKDEFNHDIVGDVPRYIPPFFPYGSPRERILIDSPPTEGDPWGQVMGWHHIQYYVSGLSK